MTPALNAVRREELRKLATAATHMPGPWDAGEGASFVLSFRDIDAGNDWPLRCVAYIAAMSPDTTLALLAYIAELEAGRWQPIETAPKTSHAIMVWCPEWCNTYEVTWNSIFHLSDEWPERRKPGWQHFGGDRRLLEVPTHWRHLPMPPEDAALLPKSMSFPRLTSEGDALPTEGILRPLADREKSADTLMNQASEKRRHAAVLVTDAEALEKLAYDTADYCGGGEP